MIDLLIRLFIYANVTVLDLGLTLCYDFVRARKHRGSSRIISKIQERGMKALFCLDIRLKYYLTDPL
jgi:hypothetical protein